MRLFFSAAIPFFIIIFSVLNLHAQDVLSNFESRLEDYKAKAPSERVFLINDRDVYAPGDIIWISAHIFDIANPELSGASEKVSITVRNRDDVEVLTKGLPVIEGKASGFIKLPDRMNEGIYYLSASSPHSGDIIHYLRKIAVRETVIPPYIIEVNFPDKVYIPGNDIAMSITFKDFYNEPKKNVSYQLFLYDGEKKVREYDGKVKKGGVATQNIKLPTRLKSGIFSYKIQAEVKDVIAEQSGVLPVLSEKVFVDFYPQSGRIINGIENVINFHVYNAYGQPLQIEGAIHTEGNFVGNVSTNENGLGSFLIKPGSVQQYELLIKTPVILDESYILPEINDSGSHMSITKIDENSAEVLIRNNYKLPAQNVLIGVSGNKIFWESEQEIDKEGKILVDLKKASGSVGHFILINKKEEIEAESITLLKPYSVSELNPGIGNGNPTTRSKAMLSQKTPNANGSFVLSSVNVAWMLDQLNNVNPNIIGLPGDIMLSSPFHQTSFIKSGHNIEVLDQHLKYYVPGTFSWGKILDTDGALKLPLINGMVINNQALYEDILSMNSDQKVDGRIVQSNLTAIPDFTASNPKYISKLYKVMKEREPAYKALLENGTPLLDVIQTIRPFSLQGNKIVFYGGSNSLMAQDGALVVIDGMQRGTDASVLQNVSPFDVDKINVSTNPNDIQRYTGLNSVGLIEIWMKRGELVDSDEEMLEQDLEFESPDYDNTRGEKEDYRSTLMWNVTDAQAGSNYELNYFHSDLISPVKVRLFFIPENGMPGYYEMEYEMK